MKSGEEIALIDGCGSLATAVILNASPKGTLVRIQTVERAANRSKITLAFSVPKGQALDFIVHRATELGVAVLQPLETAHSMRVKGWNEDRWKKVITESAKQCQELFFPTLLAPHELQSWLATRSTRPLVFCDEAERSATWMGVGTSSGVDLLIGAEGGWSLEESKLIRSQGAFLLGLGKNRLRAELAAIVALVLTKQKLGEL